MHATSAAVVALASVAGGCAHADLRRTLAMEPFESTSVEHLQAKAESVFPIGTTISEVRRRLGKDSGEIPPLIMFLTLRPWPFDPWSIEGENGGLQAQSEDNRSWFLWWERRFINLSFKFDDTKRLRSIVVSEGVDAL